MGVAGRFRAPVQLPEGRTLSDFSSGLSIVDTWARKHAHNAKRRGTAVVYVAFTSDGETAAGFYTLSTHSVDRESIIGGWLKRNSPSQVPAILLGMLGVDSRFQEQGLGAALLADALARSVAIADTIGAKCLIVDPANDEARSFYARYGFAPIPGAPRMYLPLKA